MHMLEAITPVAPTVVENGGQVSHGMLPACDLYVSIGHSEQRSPSEFNWPT